ncbi:ATP-binding protein [Streptomyces sp. NPDC006739]|uniref:ATP-binding protein n=1 Tax=Streptomyces sp. NPDC006739 TaxID=3364763 RepID=UPI00368A7785
MYLSPAKQTARAAGPAPPHHAVVWDTEAPRLGEARDAVRALLARAGHAPGRRVVQDAQLVVSELLTNALKHAPGPCGLFVELVPDATAVRITVTDTSPELPEGRPHDPRRAGGHGLWLVGMVSSRVEAVPVPGGKRVTATLALRAEHGGTGRARRAEPEQTRR